MSEGYTAKEIQVLTGLEGVRKRPAMYIGDTGKYGMHHLVEEIVANAIDESLAGYCTEIEMRLHKDGSASVSDNGRGIPVDTHPQLGKPAMEVVATTLHAGGKFEKKAYQVSGGLHGVGLSVVNALSEWLVIHVLRDGKIYEQKHARGKAQTAVKELGVTGSHGTRVHFKPDSAIFSTTEFDYELIRERIMELAFLNKGLRILFVDERTGKQESFHYEGGIAQFVEYLNKTKHTKLHPVFYHTKKIGNVECELALQYTDSYNPMLYSFVNDIRTVEGGTHIAGFKTALTRTLNDYLRSNKQLKEDRKLSGDDALEGLTAVLSMKIPEPQFEGQTKTKLGNSEIKGLVDSATYDALQTYLEENPDPAKKIAQKVVSSLEAREAAQKAKELIRRKNVFETSVLPGKLTDCSEEDPTKTELYLVEGDSAGGCFSGDTKIALTDGRNVSFRTLAIEHARGKRNFCYTIHKGGTIGIAEIKNPRCTRKNVEVVKVILDNGNAIVCTPDHLFMLRNGSYMPVRSIRSSISLMPLRRRLSRLGGGITIKGYELVYDPAEARWVFTHLLADQWNMRHGVYPLSWGAHRHHLDLNKRNNNPANIVQLSTHEHLELHRRLARQTLHTPEVKEKCRRLRRTKAFRAKMSMRMRVSSTRKILSEQAKIQWADPQYKKYMVEKFLDFYHTNEKYRKKTLRTLHKAQKEYWSRIPNREKQSKRVKTFFEAHPERRSLLSSLAKKQWDDEQLLEWRRQKTAEQWTSGFRNRRKKAYNRTYYTATIQLLREIYDIHRQLDISTYDTLRRERKNKNALLFETFTRRFFAGNIDAAREAIENYNHKIVKVIPLRKRMDVYDIEVPTTHNFALASGVFVHNSAKSARDRRYQAILPLRGKILNVEKAPIHKTLTSEEIKAIVLSLGCGFGDDFDAAKLRYHKLVIMVDADVDGAHIRTLLLTLFYRYFKSLIEKGYLYIAQPPLYRIKKGKHIGYAYNDAELEQKRQLLGDGCDIQRYKGLGEMNPDQLWETTMDPETRTLKRVTIADAMKADELFSLLMGSEVEPRREFIEAYAAQVKNLDV